MLFHKVRPKTCTMSRYFADLKIRMSRARRITRKKEAPLGVAGFCTFGWRASTVTVFWVCGRSWNRWRGHPGPSTEVLQAFKLIWERPSTRLGCLCGQDP